MARILLVDNERRGSPARGARAGRARAGDRAGRVGGGRPVRAAESGATSSSWFRRLLEASLGTRPSSSSADLLRETFDVFEDGVCLLARDGRSRSRMRSASVCFAARSRQELQGVARRRPGGGDRRSQPDARWAGLRGARLPAVGARRAALHSRRDRRTGPGDRAPAVREVRVDWDAGRRRGARDQQPRRVRAGEHRGADRAHAPHRGQAAELPEADAARAGALEPPVRGERDPPGVEGGDGAHSAHRAATWVRSRTPTRTSTSRSASTPRWSRR